MRWVSSVIGMPYAEKRIRITFAKICNCKSFKDYDAAVSTIEIERKC